MLVDRIRKFLYLGFTAAIVGGFSGIAHADDSAKKALDLIRDFAIKYCDIGPSQGSSTQWTATVTRSDLDKLVAQLAGMKITRAEVSGSSYVGVLQSDLSGLLKDQLKCRQAVFDQLQQKLLKQIQDMGPIRVAAFQVGRLVAEVSAFETILDADRKSGLNSDPTKVQELRSRVNEDKSRIQSTLKNIQIDVDASSLSFISAIFVNYQDSRAALHLQDLLKLKYDNKTLEAFRYGMEYQAYWYLAGQRQLTFDSDPMWGAYSVYERLRGYLAEVGATSAGLKFPDDSYSQRRLADMNRALRVDFGVMMGRFEQKLSEAR